MGRSYGKEYRTSEPKDSPALVEWIGYMASKIAKEGGVLTKTIIIGYDEDKHWQLACEETGPHSHFYFRWEQDEPA